MAKLPQIGLLEVVKTETFPAEPVEVFLKALVCASARRARSISPGRAIAIRTINGVDC